MDAARLAGALRATRSGRQWKCRCVAHEDRSPSMIIFDGHTGVQVRCLAGCEPLDIINILRDRGLWDARPRMVYDHQRSSTPPKVSHETDNRELARRLFDQSILCVGTPAQDYLESREIWSVAKGIEDIRFHETCPRGSHRQPALVVAMRRVAEKDFEDITAVQRIYLRRDGGRWVKDGAMMLGPVGGSAMMLWPDDSTNPGELHIAEGLETALSVLAMDRGPAWAMGSCGAIERLPVIEQVDRLVIWADNDPPGRRAALACAHRWSDAGHEVLVRTPHREGWDWADVWRARNARQ